VWRTNRKTRNRKATKHSRDSWEKINKSPVDRGLLFQMWRGLNSKS
jgi:hypothetical protein